MPRAVHIARQILEQSSANVLDAARLVEHSGVVQADDPTGYEAGFCRRPGVMDASVTPEGLASVGLV